MIIDINPLLDIVFKKLFGSLDHPALPLHFINAILAAIHQPLAVNLLIQNPFRIAQFQGDKNTELDILYTDESGRLIQLEMQTTVNSGLEKRMILNLTQLYARQLKAGEDFTKLKSVLSFWLVDKNLYDHAHWLHVFRLYCPEDNLDFNGDLRIIVLELPKWLAEFNKSSRPVSELVPLEQWLYLFTHTAGSDTRELIGALSGTIFKEAVDIMSEFTTKDRLRHAYQMRQNYKSIVTTERNDAIREGLLEGEAKAKLETAREFKKLGVALEIIEKATGLERSQLEQL